MLLSAPSPPWVIEVFRWTFHNILFVKLGKCGIDEWMLRWIENWLTVRAQRVVISGVESIWRVVSGSVPQWSVLDLVLFNISSSDIAEERRVYPH